jgi:hypothetical protein
MMEHFLHVEVQVHQDGTVRIYGNGGMIFQTIGDNVRMSTMLFPIKPVPSGELPKKIQK